MLGAEPASLPARAFVHGLRDLGWIDGRNVMIERRTAEADPQRLIGLFTDLQTLGVKVTVLAGARWIQDAAVRAAPGIPIVTLFHEDPVAAGLIASLARPGGSLTGITSTTGPEIDDKRLQLVMEMLSGVARVAFLGTKNQLERFQAGASSAASAVVPVPVDFIEHYEKAFANILDLKPGALIVGAGPLNYVNVKRIVAFAAQNRLPAIYAIREAVEDGGLMSYGPSIPGAFRQMAAMTDRILKGARAADIPVEQPTKFELEPPCTCAPDIPSRVDKTICSWAWFRSRSNQRCVPCVLPGPRSVICSQSRTGACGRSMTARILVSRASPFHTALRNCSVDGGRPFGFGDQVAMIFVLSDSAVGLLPPWSLRT